MNLSDGQKKTLESIKDELEGNITYSTTLNHSGRTSKKIVIEYDVKEKK